jgi:hypothetical protein
VGVSASLPSRDGKSTRIREVTDQVFEQVVKEVVTAVALLTDSSNVEMNRNSPPQFSHQAINRENNREFFELALKSIEFCPKSANFDLEQGINREFCGYLAEPASTLDDSTFRRDSKNYQGINREFSDSD